LSEALQCLPLGREGRSLFGRIPPSRASLQGVLPRSAMNFLRRLCAGQCAAPVGRYNYRRNWRTGAARLAPVHLRQLPNWRKPNNHGHYLHCAGPLLCASWRNWRRLVTRHNEQAVFANPRRNSVPIATERKSAGERHNCLWEEMLVTRFKEWRKRHNCARRSSACRAGACPPLPRRAESRSSDRLPLRPPASDQVSSYQSGATRERQEERGRFFLPNRLALPQRERAPKITAVSPDSLRRILSRCNAPSLPCPFRGPIRIAYSLRTARRGRHNCGY